MAPSGMEIEVKLRMPHAGGARRQLRRLGARRVGRVHERDTLFDTPGKLLKHSGRMLRVRSLEAAAPAHRARTQSARQKARRVSGVLTFKEPVEGGKYKIRAELEVAVGTPEAAEEILEKLGFRPCFRYEKYRTSFRLPGLPRLAVELDETPIGVFLELEGPQRSIDRAAKRLGFGPRDYIVASYYELFLPERHRLGLPADAMLFLARA